MTSSADPTRAASVLGAVRALALIALAASSAAAADQYGGGSAFCGGGSGCAAVRASQLGRGLGDALPVLGMTGFGLVIAGALSTRRALQRLALAAAAAGGIAAFALIALQLWVVGRVCALCMTVDVAGAAAGLVAAGGLRRFALAPAPSPRALHLTLAGVVLAALGPPAWSVARPPELPPYVRSAAAKGGLVVVELSDFECPFCRALHPVLAEALRPYGERVRLVRRSVPLVGHRHALGAALAHRCAEAQGRGEAMADVLFSSDRLGVRDLPEHARALGLEVSRFETCLSAPETRAVIQREAAEVWKSGLTGLPTVFVGGERIVGFDADAGAAPYAEALARAARGETAGRRWPMLAVLGLALLVLAPGLLAARAPAARRQ